MAGTKSGILIGSGGANGSPGAIIQLLNKKIAKHYLLRKKNEIGHIKNIKIHQTHYSETVYKAYTRFHSLLTSDLQTISVHIRYIQFYVFMDAAGVPYAFGADGV